MSAGFTIPVAVAVPIGLGAYKMKDQSAYIRFPLGFVSGILSISIVRQYAFPMIKPILDKNPHNRLPWLMFNSLWMCVLAKSVTGWYGAKEYYDKHNIKCDIDAIINTLFPGQLYFRKSIDEKTMDKNEIDTAKQEIKNGYKNLLWECGKALVAVASSVSIVKIISKYNLVEYIQKTWLLHMEMLGFCGSLMIGLYNIPISLTGLSLNHKAVVKMPWDPFTMFCTSPRDFWKNWSRPTGEELKYFIYKPLGGRKRPILSILTMFGYNAVVHIIQSGRQYALNKIDAKEMRNGWIKAFGAMGLAVSAEVVLEEKIPKVYQNFFWWKALWIGVFHISMCYTLESVRRNGVKMDLEDMVKIANQA